MRQLSRRTFLELVILASGGTLTACSRLPGLDPSDAGRAVQKDGHDVDPDSVVVAGGGLAGLSAAYELLKVGANVTVLEAQERIGGRVRSITDGFAPGYWAEWGATRIPDVHEHTLSYVKELGLNLVEFRDGTPMRFIRGSRDVHREGQDYPSSWELHGNEKSKGLGMKDEYAKELFHLLGDPRHRGWPSRALREEYDGMSWQEFLGSHGASQGWLDLYRAASGSEIEIMSALAWAALEVVDRKWARTYAVNGGNEGIVHKLRERIGESRILLGARVLRIEPGRDKVTVTFDQAGRAHAIHASRLVCAIPFSVLRDVEIVPAFSDAKTEAIRSVHMMEATRVHLQTRSRFWESEGIGGLTIAETDTPVERVWDPSHVMQGSKGLIMTYAEHARARYLASLAKSQRPAFVRQVVGEFFPQIHSEYDNAFYQKAWSEDEYVRGAWTCLRKMEISLLPEMGRPEGRVHFCGEHTSLWAGWMNGAIESAKRVTAEISESQPAASQRRRRPRHAAWGLLGLVDSRLKSLSAGEFRPRRSRVPSR